jgi:hypothetical protein
MKHLLIFLTALFCLAVAGCNKNEKQGTADMIIDHKNLNVSAIPTQWINQAISTLHIAYGHTSHGSQLTTGMQCLANHLGSQYGWSEGGAGGKLDIRDSFVCCDLGNPDFVTWAASTETYLNSHSEINVVIWSWCGQVSWASEENIDQYLDLMATLENKFPAVTFIYMTGHTDGTGLTGQLHINNEHIRNYCISNNKVLYDFEDIESYNPDGIYFGDKMTNDACLYDSNGDGTPDTNWATQWQSTHTEGADWFNCEAAHTQPLNGNMKAYAAWYLWARLAGWDGNT